MSERRSTRRAVTTKAVNYAKDQVFSDNDVFEDSPDEDAPPKRGRGRARKSNSSAAPAVVAEELNNEGVYRPPKPVYTEKGYDPSLPPIRERFPFLLEFEADGSPRLDSIVGRRPVDEKEARNEENGDDEGNIAIESDEDSDDGTEGQRSKRKKVSGKKASSLEIKQETPVEYEYLVKYKGRSYLHLEWKTGADLESMNKSTKTLYRRYLKKLQAGLDEDLEDPNFDPSYALPQKIVDMAEQEFTMELSDKELLEWEKEREKVLAEESSDSEPEVEGLKTGDNAKVGKVAAKEVAAPNEPETDKLKDEPDDEDLADWNDGVIAFSQISVERLRKIVNKDGLYYPKFEGCDNPYRDGLITEPPKKPRASYLLFQCTTRSYFQKRNPDASLGELMTILGDTWKALTPEGQEPFIQLAREEVKQYDIERLLLEKAQKSNAMWQPLRRCQMVLDRVSNDGFANIFLEPVDLEEFTDYEEVVDQPMDLATVRKKLANKKYQAPEQFARDVRKVWNNCKIYNRHGSAIWHVADYMSKQFERLYHAWVLEFRERYLRWVHPKARPWEHTCRQCDGQCGTPDDKMVLCDHCDAMYGFKCLKPPLKKLPTGIWHCPDCKPKLQSVRGVRMMSAIAEQAARKRAELGDTPKRKVKQTMYLVKWAGLGYENCTWETKEDISNPALLAEYHKLNNSFPDEPDMPAEVVDKFLHTANHIHEQNAGGVKCIPELRSQLYAQTRAFQFTKFGLDVPQKVVEVCGPKSNAAIVSNQVDAATKTHPTEVVECLKELVFRASWKESVQQMTVNASLPPLMTGEYDAIVPITAKGLMMNVGEIHGSVAFLGYRNFPDGSRGPAELNNLIRHVGDKIIAVDGVSTVNKSFKEVILLLRESGKNKFAFMRFLGTEYAVCTSDLASVGNMGRYAIEELQKKFTSDRKRLIVQRKQDLLSEEPMEADKGDETDGSAEPNDSDDESDESEGEFQPDSDEEELAVKPKKENDASPPVAKSAEQPNPIPALPFPTIATGQNEDEKQEADEQVPLAPAAPSAGAPSVVENSVEVSEETNTLIITRPELTKSLAYRLLAMDVGYSSDEGGDDDAAYFLDGLDETFTSMADIPETMVESSRKPVIGNSSELISDEKDDTCDDEQMTLPMRSTDFSTLGGRGKLLAAVALTTRLPDVDDFDNFPFASSKRLEEEKREQERKIEQQKVLEAAADGEETEDSPSKSAKKSTVKVEQVSVATNEPIHVWASAEIAAATLQISLSEIKSVLRGDYDEDLGDEVGGFRWRYAAAGATVTAPVGGTESKRNKKSKESWLEFRDRLYDPASPHIYKNGNRLRDYQVEGVNWLASTFYRKQGCVLADEMGLGKTVQIVSYVEHLFRVEKIQRPFLVVVPLSTVEHWRREFEGWTDLACCVYHDRQRVWRDVLREYEWYYADRPHTPDYLKFDVLVTTYDTLISDFDVISSVPFRVAVVDEAHRLRNQKGKLLECMKEISARGTLQYGYQSRVLMSGTPLQNDLNELWTLLNFIEPYKFSSLEEFQAQFGNMANKEQVEALQRKISPYMLRRVKEDVAKDIPAKEETLIDVELTSIQKQYYRAIFEHNHAFLNMGASRTNAPKLMNIQMELRKVCNHPCLLEGVEHREQDKQFKEFLEEGKFEGKTPEEQQHMLNEHLYIQTSGKMVLLDKLLPKLRQEGHKVLIFSQMVRMLDLISEYCEFRKYPHERLDGRVRGTDRQKSIDRFEREADSFLFLLSTRAGGVGINLTAADICIIFDSDWNPQNDVQAQARCHRIGQTKDVRIYRLITSRTFEQEMFDRASRKLGLEQAVLGSFGQDDEDDKPTSKEMEQLLKKGAYALIEDENDEIGKAFCADDIDSILAKRTRTRVVEGTKTASWLNKQGLVVSKSKFTSDSKSAAIDVDDPLFWQKVMPDFVTPAIMLQKLQDLSDEINGTSGKAKGRGRGRWRSKHNESTPTKSEDAEPNDDVTGNVGDTESTVGAGDDKRDTDPFATAPEDVDGSISDSEKDNKKDIDDKENEDGEKSGKKQLTRTDLRKVAKFMADVKSMMEGLFDDADDDGPPAEEKATAQKLMLDISVKERMFNEEQRHFARAMLKRLEGNRRRRCRTSDQPPRSTPGRRPQREEDLGGGELREELLIKSKKKRKRRTKAEMEADAIRAKRRKPNSDESGAEVGEDGYLLHSDDEADWSDIGEDPYKAATTRSGISRKESRRRRQWAADDDPATAAGRAWPAFPRNLVSKVLATVLEDVIRHDETTGGVFSIPVSRDEFPEYYEQIKHPMDYGTMKEKLEKGEYRSVQGMQKDFVRVMQNCLQFNAPNSEIVQAARQQALMRPTTLRRAALKHDLFLAEDGSVLEVYDEEIKKRGDDDGEGTPKKRRRRKNDEGELGSSAKDDVPIPRKKRGSKKVPAAPDIEDDDDDDVPLTSLRTKKPRIRISLGEPEPSKKSNKIAKRLRMESEEANDEVETTPIPRKKKQTRSGVGKSESKTPVDDTDRRKGRKRRAKNSSEEAPESEGELQEVTTSAKGEAKGKRFGESQNGASRKETSSKRVADVVKVEANTDSEDATKGNDSIYLDVAMWKREREALSDKGFKAAREHFRGHGSWSFPSALNDDKFKEVALATLNKMGRHDRYSVFAEAVTESEAPGYYDVVKKPMDLSKMNSKVENEEYGQGSAAAAAFYEDFLLMFDNCSLYNDDDGEVIEEAARLFVLLPEIYVAGCVALLKKQKKTA